MANKPTSVSNVREIKSGDAFKDIFPAGSDLDSAIIIECGHAHALISLLRVAIESGQITVTEFDMHEGTVLEALWSAQHSLDRIKAAAAALPARAPN